MHQTLVQDDGYKWIQQIGHVQADKKMDRFTK